MGVVFPYQHDGKQLKRKQRRRNHAATDISTATLLLLVVLGCSMSRVCFAFILRSNNKGGRGCSGSSFASTRRDMVRNIDLVECLIFYGQHSILKKEHDGGDGSSNFSLLPGVKSLVGECQRDDTAVIALIEGGDEESSTNVPPPVQEYLLQQCPSIHTCFITRPPPNPKDIWTAIHSIPLIQPKGFGGSAGFGTRAADPERSPLPNHCVVLCSTEHQCRAARYAGMRVLCLTDNPLADAVLDYDWSTLYMDDIATPGSFWLNPPHPRDDESNAVEIESVIQAYDQFFEQDGEAPSEVWMDREFIPFDDQVSDTELAKLLADIDPL